MRTGSCLLALGVVMLGLAGCERTRQTGPDRNVVLITIDTLRPDHLGAYGYAHDTSPNIDRLAEQGVLFRNAYSQAGWTTPSVATLMTGLYPHEHGACCFDKPIRKTADTLAEQLKRAGYTTRAHVGHALVSGTYDFDRGFDDFDAGVLGLGHPGQVTTSEQLTDRAIYGLDDLVEPYFLWVHYMDPHQMYLQHEGFTFRRSPTPRYDSEIAHNDYQVGRLLDALDERGLLDRTVVVFTADHGEELGEHGVTGHFTLHEEVLRIPLIIDSQAIAPRAVDLPVSQLDVLPTLLGLIGLAPPPGPSGRDVLAEAPPEAPIFAERIQPNAFRQRSVRSGKYKLIQIDENPAPSANTANFEYDALAKLETGLWLFDLAKDAAEKTNVLAERPAEAAALRALLEQHFEARTAEDRTIAMTPEREAELRSLGYIE
jgi:choline-sulfatase